MTPRLVGRDRSIEEPQAGGDGNREPIPLVATGPSPEELAADDEETILRKRRLADALKRLDRRERMIVNERHLSETPSTLTHLGVVLQLSRERVRQLEKRALAKLRSHRADPL
jgi:RNA polymerase sigma-32 factor